MRKALKVLVADDDPILRRTIISVLEDLGNYVVAVASGAEALALLQLPAYPDQFDLLITDRRMPQMRGEELVAHAKRLWPQMHVIMITADTISMVDRVVMTAAGVDSIILKPFDLEALETAIKDVFKSAVPDRLGREA